jgi:hypothetical protein
MPESREPGSFVDAAEQAAAAGDYASAEHFLREAASRQEADLGPLSPDLANTLNNLGVVCEMRQKAQDAEECYRRAYEIAAASLDPHHPFVETSRRNLSEFYKAQGRSLELLSPEPSLPAESPSASEAASATTAAPAPVEESTPESTSAPAYAEAVASSVSATTEYLKRSIAPALTFGRFSRPFVIVLGSFIALLLVMVATLRVWLPASSQTQAAVVNILPASSPVARAVEPANPPKAVGSETRVGAPDLRQAQLIPSVSRDEAKARAAKPAGPIGISIASGRLCRAISTAPARSVAGDWRCDPVTSPVESGSLFMYTRLKSTRDTTIQHLWYRGNELIQDVELQVRANQKTGYRTYSRYTINDRSAGNWRLEVKSRDGVVLHQERFVVR